ncbi:ArnT family glycosyltransferase [Mycobacterium sp. ML4]
MCRSVDPFVPWVTGLILIGTLIRIPQLSHRLNEMHEFRQTQTTYVALEFARRGIDLMHTPLPVFGPNADVPMEFPLAQGAAALLIRLGLGPDSAMRIVGFVGFQASAILLALLVYRWHGKLTTIVALALFELSPYGLAWGAAALVDFPSVALSLGMVVGLDSWFRSRSGTGLILGSISAWLAFLVKTTTPPAWLVLVLVSAASAYVTNRSWRRVVVGLAAGPVPGVALGLAWARHADAIKIHNPVAQYLTSAQLADWNFGSLHQRLDPISYTPALARIGLEIAGPFFAGLVFVMLGINWAPTKLERFRRAGWLATTLFGPLLLLNLYFTHSYYLIAVYPAVVAAVGIGIVAVAQRARSKTEVFAAAASVLVVIGSAVPIYNPLQWAMAPTPDLDAQRVKAATHPDDLIVVMGCDWDPTILYYADRRGLMLPDWLLPYSSKVDQVWARVKISDYRYVFTCNPRLEIEKYLPSGYSVIPGPAPGLWKINRA